MNFWHNPYIDKEKYLANLRELSKADYQYQIGNWDYEIRAGDVFDYDTIEAATISKQEFNELLTEKDILQEVITWDIAATEKVLLIIQQVVFQQYYKEKLVWCIIRKAHKKAR